MMNPGRLLPDQVTQQGQTSQSGSRSAQRLIELLQQGLTDGGIVFIPTHKLWNVFMRQTVGSPCDEALGWRTGGAPPGRRRSPGNTPPETRGQLLLGLRGETTGHTEGLSRPTTSTRGLVVFLQTVTVRSRGRLHRLNYPQSTAIRM